MILLTLAFAAACPVKVTDGDTLRICNERVRLVGIDAPEVGKCRRGRKCVKGNARVSTAALRRGVKIGPIKISRLGTDHYARTIAAVSAGGTDLSCWQLGAKAAVYVARWDNRGVVRKTCPALAR